VEISERLKSRFCKDTKIPINIFQEPYFQDRLQLFDSYYDSIKKWNLFVNELEKYKKEEDYFENYNQVKDDAINYILQTNAYQRFNKEDMNKFAVKEDLPSCDIYKPSNDGKLFISIDMVKANFSALHQYSRSMFGMDSWEGFLAQFTDNQHMINSKYIRQVILGKCNPKRQTMYEKYIMNGFLENIETYLPIVVSFSSDEIVLDITNISGGELTALLTILEYKRKNFLVPLKTEIFRLKDIGIGYERILIDGSSEFKCVDPFLVPMVLRKKQGQEITDSDLTFCHNGILARYIEIPNII